MFLLAHHIVGRRMKPNSLKRLEIEPTWFQEATNQPWHSLHPFSLSCALVVGVSFQIWLIHGHVICCDSLECMAGTERGGKWGKYSQAQTPSPFSTCPTASDSPDVINLAENFLKMWLVRNGALVWTTLKCYFVWWVISKYHYNLRDCFY